MREKIASLAKDIRASYDTLRAAARKARESETTVHEVEKNPVSLSVCAVDGGLLAHRMHGADIVVARSAGVHFVYKDSKLASFDYHPSKNPVPSLELRNSLDEHEANVFRSLVRLKHEISCALEMLDKYSPAALLLDGSLLPLPCDRPSDGSELHALYTEVVSLFETLYSGCDEKNCLLCGVIKDSRARKLSKDLDMNCSDSLLCHYLLDEGERTTEMAYSEEDSPNKELASLGSRTSVFYLKPSAADLPLRIEVLGKENTDRAASLICSLSSISENFAYPAILVEADMCAALDPRELESIEHSLHSMAGIKPLRRNLRPFR